MSVTSDRSQHVNPSTSVFSIRRVLSHTPFHSQSCAHRRSFMAAARPEPVGSGRGACSATPVTQDLRDTEQDCIDKLVDYDYLSEDCLTDHVLRGAVPI